MIDLPTDLPADLVPLSWLLGVWEGTGVLEYDAQGRTMSGEFSHRVSFSHDGGDALNYAATAWFEPFPPGPIAVDSKFPLEAWAAWQDAATPATRDLARRRFANDVRKHVDDIARKYLIAGETAEGALMFVPSEAVHAALHADLPDLVAEAARRHVHIVGPSTLWAVLNTMRGLLRDARLQVEARRIHSERWR